MWKPTRYKFILWDIDDTLIDFKLSERVAIKRCFSKRGVELTEEQIAVYSKINHGYWLMLDEGKISKSELLEARFAEFAKYLGRGGLDHREINEEYQVSLGNTAVMFDDGYEICSQLKEYCYQCAVTNGTKTAQIAKLKSTGLDQIFCDVFISEIVGVEKPNVEFFNRCFSKIPNFKKQDAIIIGDSLTSDVKGGINAQIDTCWLNAKSQPANPAISPTYQISSLAKLREIL